MIPIRVIHGTTSRYERVSVNGKTAVLIQNNRSRGSLVPVRGTRKGEVNYQLVVLFPTIFAATSTMTTPPPMYTFQQGDLQVDRGPNGIRIVACQDCPNNEPPSK